MHRVIAQTESNFKRSAVTCDVDTSETMRDFAVKIGLRMPGTTFDVKSHCEIPHSFALADITCGCLQLEVAFGLSDRTVHPLVLKNSLGTTLFTNTLCKRRPEMVDMM